MRISIKIKFSVFLAILLLLTVYILSLLVLEGIQKNQREQVEQFFEQQAATANQYLLQSLLAEQSKVPQTYLASRGAEFAKQLELISGQAVVLYDQEGQSLNRSISAPVSDSIRETLAYALRNQTTYLTENDSLYYMTPLRIGGEQVGVVQFYYSLTDNLAFYNRIKQLFVYIGAGVFLLSFMLAYVYFNRFAGAIIRLNETVDQIREGQFAAPGLKRRDEIGVLSDGIREMSEQIRDTIREKDAEREKLALAVHKLSLLDKEQKEFIGNVTHEFKTPLTSIKAYLDLLDMYPDDASLLETALASINSETQRLYEMVDKALQLSAMEKYEFEFNKEQLDTRQIILTVLNSLKGKLDKFGIALETDLSEAVVEADKDSLTLVLMNLLDNAIKYNKAGGRIHVTNKVQNGMVVMELADTGIGIPQEAAHKVFEPFYTVDKNRSREQGGAGLGLALARKYTESQGGTLKLVSTGEEGTRFRLSFPVYAGEETLG